MNRTRASIAALAGAFLVMAAAAPALAQGAAKAVLTATTTDGVFNGPITTFAGGSTPPTAVVGEDGQFTLTGSLDNLSNQPVTNENALLTLTITDQKSNRSVLSESEYTVNGVALFQHLSLSTTDTYTATLSGAALQAASLTIQPYSSNPNQVSLTSASQSSAQNAARSIVVGLADVSGSPALPPAGYGVAVTLSISPSNQGTVSPTTVTLTQATPQATVTFTPAASTSQATTLTATAQGYGNGTLSINTVNASTATSLVLSAPATVVSGSNLSLSVEVVNAQGTQVPLTISQNSPDPISVLADASGQTLAATAVAQGGDWVLNGTELFSIQVPSSITAGNVVMFVTANINGAVLPSAEASATVMSTSTSTSTGSSSGSSTSGNTSSASSNGTVDVIQLVIGQSRAVVNGSTVALQAPAAIIHNRTEVPLRFLAQAFGFKVNYIAQNRLIVVTQGQKTLTVAIGASSALERNGTTVKSLTLDSPPVIRNNFTLVPIRFIAQAFGAQVNWVGATRTVNITYLPI